MLLLNLFKTNDLFNLIKTDNNLHGLEKEISCVVQWNSNPEILRQ